MARRHVMTAALRQQPAWAGAAGIGCFRPVQSLHCNSVDFAG
jgi:hypothetical protein